MGFKDIYSRCGCGSKEEKPKNPPPTVPGTRIQWSSPTEFLLTCIGYSVGLGNVWRFPYLCYKSGGGAFLIPYVIMMILIGMPLLFMEYSFGQYFGVGGLTIFKKVCPMFQGVGVGYMVLNGLVSVYYNVIIAIALYYMFASFTSDLPWGSCGHEWNTPQCSEIMSPNASMVPLNYTELNGTMVNGTMMVNGTAVIAENITRYSPSDEYFRHMLLNLKDHHSISDLGELRWHLVLCLVLAWILVILFVSRGIKSTGKVAYFTATFPYIMLTVLVVRGVTLPGASDGLIYFLKPDWVRLKDPDVWFAAAAQLFYSTNLAWGGMITMASYNSFDHNCYKDAIMINLVSFFTSLYAGFAVFSIIGFMANEAGIEVSKVIDSGPGLAFIVYPRALSMMPLAPMWSALFFFMLFLLGIGSQMVLMETVVTGIVDEFPRLGLNWCLRLATTISVAVFFLLLGLPQATQGGMYVLQLMDWYSASFSVLFIAIVECVVINWIYKNERFAANVKEMLNHYPQLWWRLCWKYISPVIVVFILVFSFVRYKPAKYGDYEYPLWADFTGWCMVLACISPMFVIAIFRFYRAEGQTWYQKWENATRPKLDNNIEVNDHEKKIYMTTEDHPEHEGDGDDAEKNLLKKKEAMENNSTSVV